MSRRLIIFVVTFIFVLIFCGSVSADSNVYVGQNGSDTSGNGSVDNPYQTINYAISKVDINGTVNIGKGTFNKYIDDNHKDYNITINKNINIKGSGQKLTVIDANGLSRIFIINPDCTVTISNLTMTNGKAPDGTTGSGGENGGAIVNSGTLRLNNVIITGSKAGNGGNGAGGTFLHPDGKKGGSGGNGGAIYSTGTLTIINSILSDNSAGNGGSGGNGYSDIVYGGAGGNGGYSGYGGAIVNSGVLTIINSTFSGNHAGNGGKGGDCAYSFVFSSDAGRGGSGGDGGAIANMGSLTIVGSVFSGNCAGNGGNGGEGYIGSGGDGGSGGAIVNSGVLTIINSTFSGNYAGKGGSGLLIMGSGGSGGSGGAIYNGETLTIVGSVFSGNCAGNGGDGASTDVAAPGGSGGSGGNGGAIYNLGTLTISDGLFSGNCAGNGGNGGFGQKSEDRGYDGGSGGSGGSGGAIYNGETLTIVGSVFSGNCAGNGGNGGLGSGEGSAVLFIAAGNGGSGGSGGSGGAIYNVGTLTITGSVFSGNRAGNGGNGGLAPAGGNGGSGGNGGNGGAIYNGDGSKANLYVTKCFITNNGPGSKGIKRPGGSDGIDGVVGGIYVGAVSADSKLVVQYNCLLNNGKYDIKSESCLVDARYNWWGLNSNPNSRINGLVTYDPWIILTIIVSSADVYYNGNLTVTANMNRLSNGSISSDYIPDGIPVIFTTSWGILTPYSTAIVNGNAKIIYTANGETISTTPIRIYAIVDNENNVYTQINVLKMPASVTVNSEHNFTGQKVILEANVTDLNGNSVNGGTVTFVVNGVSVGTVDVVNGIAKITWTIPCNWNAGIYNQEIIYSGTGNYLACTGSSSLVVDKTPVNVVMGPVVNFAGQNVTLNVNVTDYYCNLVNGGTVTFVVNGVSVGTVDVVNGIAKITWTIPCNWNAGIYNQEIIYSGTGNYLACTGSSSLVVDKTPVNVVVFNVVGNKGKSVNLTTVLRDYYSKPLSGKTVKFKVNGVVIGTAITGVDGTAILSYYIKLNGGNYAVKAYFTGDNNYLPSLGSNTLKVPTSRIYVTITPSKIKPTLGKTITLTFKMGNKGPDTAENVVFKWVMPKGMKLINIQGNPKYSYNAKTRTLTWTLKKVVVGDPVLKVNVKIIKTGNLIIKPQVTTDTYDPTLKKDIKSINIKPVTQTQVNAAYNTHIKTLKAKNNTILLQNTGIPIKTFILAILTILAGITAPKIKN